LIKKDDVLRPGDYFKMPIVAGAGSFGGLEFEALDIKETELELIPK
jgi:hypothetical protein